MGNPVYVWWTLLVLWVSITVAWFIFQPIVQGIMDNMAIHCTTSESQTVLSSLRFAWYAWPILLVVFSLIWVFTHSQKPNWESQQEYYGVG